MLNVSRKEEIRRAFFIEGKSIRWIAREGHHDRVTVRKAIHNAGPSCYSLSQPRPRPVLGPFVEFIDQWLAEDQLRPPKQHHTARRIYHRLKEEQQLPRRRIHRQGLCPKTPRQAVSGFHSSCLRAGRGCSGRLRRSPGDNERPPPHRATLRRTAVLLQDTFPQCFSQSAAGGSLRGP